MTGLSPGARKFAARLAEAPDGTSAQLIAITVEEHGQAQSKILCGIDDVVCAVLLPHEAAALVRTIAELRPQMTEEQRDTYDELSEGLVEILEAISHPYRKGMH